MLARKPLDKIFTLGFRTSSKLVWNGENFVTALAGETAYMVDPETGTRLTVTESNATNVITNSTDFTLGIGSNLSVQEVDGIFPDTPGYLLTNEHESSTSVGFTRTFTISLSPITYYCITGKGTSNTVRYGIRNQTRSQWVSYVTYNWDTDELNYSEVHGQPRYISKLKLNDDIILLTITVDPIEEQNGEVGAAYFYPGVDGPGTNTIIYHMQVERTLYWSSPIITGSEAVTRGGDTLRLDNFDDILGNTSEGTMFIECRYPNIPLDGNNYVLINETIDGNNNFRQMLYPRGIYDSMTIYVCNSPSQVNWTATERLMKDAKLFKSAASFSEDNLSVSMNEETATMENTVGLPDGINRITLMQGRPMWVAKIWRDKIGRTPEELRELTS